MVVGAGKYKYALGPWQWRAGSDEPGEPVGWYGPVGVQHAVDLRPIGDHGPGPVARGFGFFVLDPRADIPPGYIDLGVDLTSRPRAASRLSSEAMLSLSRNDLDRPSLVAWLWGLLNDLADPTGSNLNRCICPSPSGVMRVKFGTMGINVEEPYDRAKHPYVKSLLRNIYQLEEDRYKSSFLDRMTKATGLSRTDIATPSGGATSASETWPTNQTALATNQDNTWTETAGNIDVESGTATNIGTGNAHARCEVDMDTDDMEAYCVSNSLGANARVANLVRVPSASFTGYSGGFRSSTAEERIDKWSDATTFANLVSTGTDVLTNGVENKVRIVASDITIYLADVESNSTTDATYTTGKRAGIATVSGSDRRADWDNWTARDWPLATDPAAVRSHVAVSSGVHI